MNQLLIRITNSPTVAGVLLVIWLGLTTGCTTSQKTPSPPPDPRSLPIFDGTTEARISWSDLVDRANAVEVIVIGEEHDDPGAHAVQLELLKTILTTDSAAALSLEMLERDEQVLVDAWLAGSIETDDFVERTGSRNWGGEEGWYRFYQPALDAARSSDAPIIAANAPRRYVSRARKEGYGVLQSLPEAERDWFDIPPALDDGPYYERFAETMRGFRGDEIEEDAIIATFRSQQVWDATMARSVTMAMQDPEIDRVIHFIGRFHSDLEGGTIGEIRRLRPETDLLVISCVRRSDAMNALDPEDIGRGDVVVYTPDSTSAD